MALMTTEQLRPRIPAADYARLRAIESVQGAGATIAERERLQAHHIKNPAPAGVAAPDSSDSAAQSHVARDALPAAGPKPQSALDYALAYAALGWPVLPIEPKGKRPLGGKGIDHATTNAHTIRGWFKRWPSAGIGIHLAAAGLCAIDIDPRNGSTKTPGDFPATLTARTGGGGWHLIYKAPEGVALPGKLEAGVDIKWRGYIIVAPSMHPSGGRYEWL
jgi:hypothetical protein